MQQNHRVRVIFTKTKKEEPRKPVNGQKHETNSCGVYALKMCFRVKLKFCVAFALTLAKYTFVQNCSTDHVANENASRTSSDDCSVKKSIMTPSVVCT